MKSSRWKRQANILSKKIKNNITANRWTKTDKDMIADFSDNLISANERDSQKQLCTKVKQLMKIDFEY